MDILRDLPGHLNTVLPDRDPPQPEPELPQRSGDLFFEPEEGVVCPGIGAALYREPDNISLHAPVRDPADFPVVNAFGDTLLKECRVRFCHGCLNSFFRLR